MATQPQLVSPPRLTFSLILQAMGIPNRSLEDQQIWEDLLAKTEQKYDAVIAKHKNGPLPAKFTQFLQQFQSYPSNEVYASHSKNYKNIPVYFLDFFMTVDQLTYVAHYQLRIVQEGTKASPPRHDPELAALQSIIAQTSAVEQRMRETLRSIEIIRGRIEEQEKQFPKIIKEIADEKQRRHELLQDTYKELHSRGVDSLISLRQSIVKNLRAWMRLDLAALPAEDPRLIIGGQGHQIVGEIEKILHDLYRTDIMQIDPEAAYDATTMRSDTNRPTPRIELRGKVAEVVEAGFWQTNDVGVRRVYQKAVVAIYTST